MSLSSLPLEYPLICFQLKNPSQVLIKGNKEGIIALIDAATNAIAYEQAQSELFLIGGEVCQLSIELVI